jgi:hypothetical protein
LACVALVGVALPLFTIWMRRDPAGKFRNISGLGSFMIQMPLLPMSVCIVQ